jgi:hypothetical protein
VVFDAWVWLERLAAAGANFGAHQISPYEIRMGTAEHHKAQVVNQ